VEFRWRPERPGRKRFRGGRLPGFRLEIHPHFAELRIIRQVIGAIGIPGMAQLLTDSVLESYARIMNLVLVSPCSDGIPKEIFFRVPLRFSCSVLMDCSPSRSSGAAVACRSQLIPGSESASSAMICLI
jgi:hypothetical protein